MKHARIHFSIPRLLGFFFLGMTALTLCLPLHPTMPGADLDPSWVFAINEATARGLIFGQDIVFTFGPYASVYTRAYHPELVALTWVGCLTLGLSLALVIGLLARKQPLRWWLAALLVLTATWFTTDVLLFLYPLLLTILIHHLTALDHPEKKLNPASLLLLIPLGLLPLIKFSSLPLCCMSTLLIAGWLWFRQHRIGAVISLLMVLLSTVSFWILSDQKLPHLLDFFKNSAPIIFGYAAAMSLGSKFREIIAYVLTSSGMIWILLRTTTLPKPSKIFLGLSFALFLFLVFKAGFVRHDGHAMIAANTLLISTLCFNGCFKHRFKITLCLAALLTWGLMAWRHLDHPINTLLHNLQTHASAVIHYPSEHAQLPQQFQNNLTLIQKQFPIPRWPGNTDIYSYRQGALLASEHIWSPRPIFQSYSAYTPLLAQMNEAHLRSAAAPDHVVFAVEPIDDRLPALEDGLSWPTLMGRYELGSQSENHLFLKKKENASTQPIGFKPISQSNHAFKENVQLPPLDLLFAQITLQPTFWGRCVNLLFKGQLLNIQLELSNGQTQTYRLIPGMAQAGFILSPLVENTSEWKTLMTAPERLTGKTVRSFSIEPVGHFPGFWKPTYELALFSLSHKVEKR